MKLCRITSHHVVNLWKLILRSHVIKIDDVIVLWRHSGKKIEKIAYFVIKSDYFYQLLWFFAGWYKIKIKKRKQMKILVWYLDILLTSAVCDVKNLQKKPSYFSDLAVKSTFYPTELIFSQMIHKYLRFLKTFYFAIMATFWWRNHQITSYLTSLWRHKLFLSILRNSICSIRYHFIWLMWLKNLLISTWKGKKVAMLSYIEL